MIITACISNDDKERETREQVLPAQGGFGFAPMQAAGDGACLGDAPALVNAGGAYGERTTGTRYSTRLLFLRSSKLTCGENQCTDNLLPTCCVCHGTQSLGSSASYPVPGNLTSSWCYLGVLDFAAHLPIRTAVARRQQTGHCRLCRPAALVSPISPISSSCLGAPQFARQGARGSGIQGPRPAKASVSSRSAPLFCGSHTGWPLNDSSARAKGGIGARDAGRQRWQHDLIVGSGLFTSLPGRLYAPSTALGVILSKEPKHNAVAGKRPTPVR